MLKSLLCELYYRARDLFEWLQFHARKINDIHMLIAVMAISILVAAWRTHRIETQNEKALGELLRMSTEASKSAPSNSDGAAGAQRSIPQKSHRAPPRINAASGESDSKEKSGAKATSDPQRSQSGRDAYLSIPRNLFSTPRATIENQCEKIAASYGILPTEQNVATRRYFQKVLDMRDLAEEQEKKARTRFYYSTRDGGYTSGPNRVLDQVIFDAIDANELPLRLQKKWALFTAARELAKKERYRSYKFVFNAGECRDALLQMKFNYGHLLALECSARLSYRILEESYVTEVAYQQVVEALPDEDELIHCSEESVRAALRRRELELGIDLTPNRSRWENPILYQLMEANRPPELTVEQTVQQRADREARKGSMWHVGEPELPNPSKDDFKKRVTWLQTGPPLTELHRLIQKIHALQVAEYAWDRELEIPAEPRVLAKWVMPAFGRSR